MMGVSLFFSEAPLLAMLHSHPPEIQRLKNPSDLEDESGENLPWSFPHLGHGGKLRKDGKSLEKSWKLQTIGAKSFARVFGVLLGFFPIDSQVPNVGFSGYRYGQAKYVFFHVFSVDKIW